MSTRTRRSSRSGGFTLIELIAVLVIVGIIALAAVPSLANAGEARQSAAARLLFHDMLYARQYAVASGARVWIEFNVASDQWTILAEDVDNPGRANASALEDPATGQPMLITLGAGEWAGTALANADFDGNTSLGFDWLGRPLNQSEGLLAADSSVSLASGASVTVTAGTGHMQLSVP